MPYIDAPSREKLDQTGNPESAGELNYAITLVLKAYLERKGGPKYALLNEMIGVLECAKLELYRRIVAPYEDTKIAQNGDVW